MRICHVVTIVAFLEAVIYGYTFPYFSIYLESLGVGSTLIGLNATVGLLSVVLFFPLYPKIIEKLGYYRATLASFFVISCSSIFLHAFDHVTWSFIIRFVMGASLAGLWISTEAWLNDVVPDHVRGRTNAVFQMLYSLGFFVGPSATYLTGFQGVGPIIFLCAVSVAALVVLVSFGSGGDVHGVSNTDTDGSRRLTRDLIIDARVLLFLALVTGICETAMYTLLPIYGLGLGFSAGFAVSVLVAYTLGEVVVAFPIAWLSDRVEPVKILLFCSGGASFAVLLLVPFMDKPALGWLMALLAGGLVVSLYNVGLVQLGSRYRGAALPVLVTAFSVVYSIGSAAGSSIGGVLIEVIGPVGLPVGIAAVLFVTATVQFSSLLREGEKNR